MLRLFTKSRLNSFSSNSVLRALHQQLQALSAHGSLVLIADLAASLPSVLLVWFGFRTFHLHSCTVNTIPITLDKAL